MSENRTPWPCGSPQLRRGFHHIHSSFRLAPWEESTASTPKRLQSPDTPGRARTEGIHVALTNFLALARNRLRRCGASPNRLRLVKTSLTSLLEGNSRQGWPTGLSSRKWGLQCTVTAPAACVCASPKAITWRLQGRPSFGSPWRQVATLQLLANIYKYI